MYNYATNAFSPLAVRHAPFCCAISAKYAPIAEHICSWAGLAPGNHESAGKKKKERVTPGNNYLKTILCEIAWVIAAHREYLSGWYWQLKQRTDSKRAIVALARKLLVIIYAMLKKNQPFDEQKFLERKETANRKRVSRMVNELTNVSSG